MKKVFGIVAMAIFSLAAVAQNNALDKYFTQYQGDEDFSKVSISGKVFEMTAYLETDDADIEEVKEFASGIEGLKMLIGENVDENFSKYNAAAIKVAKSYEELMSVDDKDGKFTFYIDERNGVVKEFVVVATVENNLVLVSLVGKMDLRQLSKISQKINNEGFDYIGKMNDHGANKIKVYPNPVAEGSLIDVEVPGELNGAKLTIYDMNGKVVKSEKITSTKMSVSVNAMSKGQYILEFIKGDSSIKKKLNVN